jgi:hypothetical protein
MELFEKKILEEIDPDYDKKTEEEKNEILASKYTLY